MAQKVVKNAGFHFATGPAAWKKRVTAILRVLVPVAILAWLLYDVQRKDPTTLSRLVTRPKDLWLLLASFGCLFTAVCFSFVRWFLLVRALEIPFTLQAAFRLGFLGYLFNFVGPGAVGGDVFKAYFVARGQKTRRAETVATILLDRIVGLYSLMVVASLAISFQRSSQLSRLEDFLTTVQWLTLIGGVGFGILLIPARCSKWLVRPLRNLPLVGPVVLRVTFALELYRRRKAWLVLIAVLSLSVHVLTGICIDLADRAVFRPTPSLHEHLVISPLASAAGGLPVPGGLGTYELAMHYLYQQLPKERNLEQGQGLVVALCYRLMTITIAAVGGLFYVRNRGNVAEIVAAIESDEAAGGRD